MKIYIAARAKTRAEKVKQIQKKLRSMGHSITYDWASENHRILKPYRYPHHRKNNSLAIPKMLKAATKADIFVLLDEPGLRGAYVELGAFLSDVISNPKNRKVYIVGPDSHEREFIFESPDYVIFAENMGEVYQSLQE